MAHSNQVREFAFTRRGIDVREAHPANGAVFEGSNGLHHENRDQAANLKSPREMAERSEAI
jgi:hypothetical protein